MSRKDYELIAEVLRHNKPPEGSDGDERLLWESIVEDMTFALQTDNPRFDAQRFKAACQ